MLKPNMVFSQFILIAFVVLTLGALSSCSRYQIVDHLVYQQPLVATAIININVLSEDGETMIPNQNVLIEKGQIIRVTDSKLSGEGIKIIDGSGKYLIPGLVESHAHLQDSPNDLLVFAAHGVTYLREMSGDALHLQWKEEVSSGRVGPKIYLVSRKVMSKPGIMGFGESLVRNRLNITTQSDAVELVDELIEDGYQGVKISSFLSKPMYLALTKAAKDKGLAIVGHIPSSVRLTDLWSSGHKELAHIEELTKSLNNEFGYYNSETPADFLKYVENRSDEVAIKLKQHGISVGTTLWYMQTLPKQALELEGLIESLDLTYGNPERVADWMPGENYFEVSKEIRDDPDALKEYKMFWGTYVEAIHIMLTALIKHDVVLLAGTDSMTSMVIPGVSLHAELESLVNAGMTPAQALRSATLVPGEWMKSNTGKIVAGYDADLIILNANPLLNIKNTQQIDSVILAGKLLDKAMLENILQSVREAYDHVAIE